MHLRRFIFPPPSPPSPPSLLLPLPPPPLRRYSRYLLFFHCPLSPPLSLSRFLPLSPFSSFTSFPRALVARDRVEFNATRAGAPSLLTLLELRYLKLSTSIFCRISTVTGLAVNNVIRDILRYSCGRARLNPARICERFPGRCIRQ